MARWKAVLLLIVLLITSFSSIVYEVVWGRELSFIFGTSAFAITTVLTAFMAGLALGSLFGGRIIDSIKKKYQFLALTEISIGITCLLTLYLLKLVKFPYLWLYDVFNGGVMFNFVLFILAFIILFVPTFLIGLAFPAVVKLYFNEMKQVGKTVGTTYMFDTIGGALGALLAGFFLIAAFGFFRVSVFASVLNVLCGIVLIGAFWKKSFDTSHTTHEPTRHDRKILIIFFLSGFAALMFEVIWTRNISLIYGSSLHSFAIVLSAFLAGLGIGSMVASRWIDRVKEKLVLFAFIELLIGVLGMILIVFFPALERLFLYLYFHIGSFNVFMFLLFIACFLILLLPTMLMGATLPVLSSVYASEKQVGTDVGKLFSVNSFGSIFGSFFAGFILIPAAGLVYSSMIAGLIYIGIAIAILYYFTEELSKEATKDVFLLVLLVTIFGFIFLLSFYDPDYSFKGVYYHGTRYDDENYIFQVNIEDSSETLFESHSPYGLVTVLRSWDESNVWLKNNGKTDASLGDMLTQGLLSHLPLSMHENPHTVLNIGMGGAFSLSSILAYEDVESADVVEIDPEVVRACGTVLAPYNNYALSDIRTEVIVADGRNYLFATDKKFDVIISEPPNIWISGVSNLFTKEFYEIVRAHLEDGGIFSQWFPFYEMNEYDYMISLRTLRSIFPYLYEFTLEGDIIILASMHPIEPYDDINRWRITYPYVDSDFTLMIEYSDQYEEFYYDNYDPFERNYDFLLSYYTKNPYEIDQYIDSVPLSLINTDDRPVLEFSTLRNKYPKFQVQI